MKRIFLISCFFFLLQNVYSQNHYFFKGGVNYFRTAKTVKNSGRAIPSAEYNNDVKGISIMGVGYGKEWEERSFGMQIELGFNQIGSTEETQTEFPDYTKIYRSTLKQDNIHFDFIGKGIIPIARWLNINLTGGATTGFEFSRTLQISDRIVFVDESKEENLDENTFYPELQHDEFRGRFGVLGGIEVDLMITRKVGILMTTDYRITIYDTERILDQLNIYVMPTFNISLGMRFRFIDDSIFKYKEVTF
ncbi:MAG: hypothetical protein ACPG19_13365 [Saprospiraceae bacterium]